MDEDAYSGRWVARLRGKIVAQGGTPEQARQAAASRFKEEAEIIFMPLPKVQVDSPLLERVQAALPAKCEVYLVGGAVRDLLLGRAIHDYDFALPGDGITAARSVANALKAAFYILDEKRKTGRVIINTDEGPNIFLDFASFRGPDLDADLIGRDFTLNAIAFDVRTRHIFDPLGGVQDLKDRLLRSCSVTSFDDDPVRILRGIRLAANFDFRILPETREAMRASAAGLERVSVERLRDELFRILDGRAPAPCIRSLDMLGALGAILPELIHLKKVPQPAPHVHDVWEHTLGVVRALETILNCLTATLESEPADNLLDGMMVMRLGRYRHQITAHLSSAITHPRSLRGLLFFAALYHDIAKPVVSQKSEQGRIRFWDHEYQGAYLASERASNLALSNEEITHLDMVIRSHMRILHHTNRLLTEGKMPTRRAIYRFFKDTGSAGVDVCLLALADTRGIYEHTLSQETWDASLTVIRLLLENWFEKPAESICPPSLVNGDDLKSELDLDAGPIIGHLLSVIREAQAMGEVSTKEEALEFARKACP